VACSGTALLLLEIEVDVEKTKGGKEEGKGIRRSRPDDGGSKDL
jgi:hypothetical protein